MMQAPMRAVALFLVLLLAGCSGHSDDAGYKRIYAPADGDSLKAHIFELDNGLRVYLSENHEAPNFYAEIVVRAGSKHDPADATGLAHYLEHLLFKGSRHLGTLDYAAEAPHLARIEELYEEHFRETDRQRRADIYAQINAESQQAASYAIPNEIDKVYSSMGGSGLNAHTSNEETVYKIYLPANRLKQWAAIESDRFMEPVFRLFHTELETVYEEKNRSLDSAGRIIGTATNQLLFKAHPYGQQPTLGTVEHLKNPSLVYIKDFFDTWYVPNNMAIAISGDIDIEETMEVIAEAFGGWQPRPLPEVGPWDEPPLEGVERATVQYPGREAVRLAFRTAGNRSADREALRVLDMILDNSVAGLINLNLNQRQRVMGAGSGPRFMNDAGMQFLFGSPKQDQTLAEVEQLLLEQVEAIKAGDFEDWIIPAIINDLKKTRTARLESNTAIVTMMRSAFIQFADWRDHLGVMERLEQVSREDVVNVANKYFGDDYVAVYRVNAQHDIPAVDKPQIDPVSMDSSRQSAFAARVLAMDYELIEPKFIEAGRDYQVLEFAPGVDFYYAPNPLNDLFSLIVSVDVGTETYRNLGLADSLMALAGTERLDNEELKKRWYRLGSDFRFFTGANGSGFGVSGLDDNFEQSLALMLEGIRTPVASDEVLEQLQGRVLKSRADQRQSPPTIAAALTSYHRYGDQSPYLERLSSAQIKATKAQQLLALPQQLLGYKHAITYTGSLPLDEVLEILRRHYRPAAELREPPSPRLRKMRQVSDNEVMVVDKHAAQAQVRIAFPDGTLNEDDTVAAMLYNNYFGNGLSSVVFQELREARALAYSASASYAQGRRTASENRLVGRIGTQMDKTVDALQAFVDLIDNMPQSPERFDETVDSLVNRYRTSRTGFRSVVGAVRGWQYRGLDGDPGPARFAKLQDMELADMLQFHRDHIADRPKLISVMADLSVIDADALAQFGTVRQAQVEELFTD